MRYHIDTALIVDKFNSNCDCPLCEIQKIVEEQFLQEFLNDAVMEDNSRIAVGKKGFCDKHFDMLFSRQNKLSVALQIDTRINNLEKIFSSIGNVSGAKKRAKLIDEEMSKCIICDYVQESMEKYYKTVAQMFLHEKDFFRSLIRSKGFCLNHFSKLLQYSSCAGGMSKHYVETLLQTEKRAFDVIKTDLKTFCDKHDYRNAMNPLGSAENALPNTRIKLYGKKFD